MGDENADVGVCVCVCGCRGGQYLNFDLAYPSSAIPDDFFPSNETFYGYKAGSSPPLRSSLATA